MFNPIPNRLPLIPLSPLFKTSNEIKKALDQITKSLSEETKPSVKQTLEKEQTKLTEKLEKLKRTMHTLQTSFLYHFSTAEIAKEIAYINASLFKRASLTEHELSSSVVPLLDFHHYLTHAFAHQIIFDYDNPQRKKKTDLNMVAELIQMAYLLVHIYRDFSGSTAILTCLELPQIKRLERVWQTCPARLLKVYRQLQPILQPDPYRQQLHQQLSQFRPTQPHLIAIPHIQSHLLEIQQLFKTYSIHDRLLSSQGQESLSEIFQILSFCQDGQNLPEIQVRTKPSRVRLSIPPCRVLDEIGTNPNVYHWLVSRVYLDFQQLMVESLEVEGGLQEMVDGLMVQSRLGCEGTVAVGSSGLIVHHLPEIALDSSPKTDSPETTLDGSPKTDSPEATLDCSSKTDSPETTLDGSPKSDSPETTLDCSPKTDSPETTLDCSSKTDSPETTLDGSSKTDSPETTLDGSPKTDSPEVTADEPSVTFKGDPIETGLSPTAPEFIPQTDDEEEWTGYPIENSPVEEEEEWTGYPITSDDEEEEIWKGYPMPIEEWHKKNNLFAIGKAAARRIHCTDTKKRLPSPFAPP